MTTTAQIQIDSPTGTLPTARAITVAILAMGGEGGGVLADWIVDLAEHSGYCAQTTSVPGVAQRTGSTIYYVEIFPEARVLETGKEPVLALMPIPGEVDIVIASELMEAGRAIQRGFVTPDRTTLIASTHRVFSMTERTALADGQVDAAKLTSACAEVAKHFVRGDFACLASENRSVISAALFGALAATKTLPFHREQFEEAVRRGGVGVDFSLQAFAAGFEAAASPASSSATAIHTTAAPARKLGVKLQPLAQIIREQFPSAAHDILFIAIERLADYQDVAYAAHYLKCLEAIRDCEKERGDGTFRLLREAATQLALWMSYEDAIRVADLKTRRSRFQRVHREANAAATQLIQIHEFLHPGVEEIADILPAALGRWILRTEWVKRRMERATRRGQIVQTTSLRGFLQLYFLSGLRRWRRKSLRFQDEQKRISAWLEVIPNLAKDNYELAVEFAELPRVVKGYGDTHLRGRKNLDAILTAIPAFRHKPDAALRLKQVREAALADDTSEKLNATLLEVTT